MHRVLVDLVQAQAESFGDEAATRRVEVDKRVSTIEDLVTKVLRGLVAFAIVAVIMGAFDLWPLVAGLGLVIAAITLAGQEIVLDYLMGILILVEGQYFKGDIVRVGAIEGTVEEVGLRRTVVRDTRGTVHSLSNGLIRSSSNLTRSYAMAVVHIEGIADGDVEGAIAVLDSVGRAAAADPVLGRAADRHPGLYGHHPPVGLWRDPQARAAASSPSIGSRVEAELRRRVAAELAAAGIEPIRAAGGQAAAPVDREAPRP